jgi:hypothetical protein
MQPVFGILDDIITARDHNGQPTCLHLFNRTADQAKLLTRDEARRIAANIAKLSGVVLRNLTWGLGLAACSCRPQISGSVTMPIEVIIDQRPLPVRWRVWPKSDRLL